MLPIFINLLLAIHVVVSLLIIFVVLMQRPKNEGLGAAFGGGMTDNLFGAQTTNVLQNFTRWLGGIFFALTLLLSVLYSKQTALNAKSDITKQLLNAPKPPAAATTAPPIDEAGIKEKIEAAIAKAAKEAPAKPAASAAPAASAPADAAKKDAK